MKRMFLIGFTTLGLAFVPTVASAMSDADCEAAWKAADTNADGSVTETEGAKYFAALRVADRPATDKMSKADFQTHCKAGLFDARQVDAGAPLKGANSFTEAQAKNRAMAEGLIDVGALAKDGDGIWRGTAKRGDKQVSVAVDYKGNVVAQ